LEDHTRLLRNLAGQIIFEYGSLEKFWQGLSADAGALAETTARLKPGYFLLLARKGA